MQRKIRRTSLVSLLLITLITVASVGAVAAPATVSASSPDDANPGETVTVSFTLTNTGDSASGYILDLSLPDGWEVVDHTDDDGTWKANENKWLWNTVNADSSRTASVTLSIPSGESGEQTVVADVKDSNGVQASASHTIAVGSTNTPPDADFTYTPTSPEADETVSVDASASTDDDGTIESYDWDFDGDGTAEASGQTATTAYSQTGDYDITLTVTDDDGATDQVTKTVPVSDSVGYLGGEVTDASGNTVPGATVSIVDTASDETVETLSTDSDGTFDTFKVSPGTYQVTVEKDGYESWSGGYDVDSGETKSVDAVLQETVESRYGSIEGRVTNENNHDLPADVRLLDADTGDPLTEYFPTDGYYRFEGVSAGQAVMVEATYDGKTGRSTPVTIEQDATATANVVVLGADVSGELRVTQLDPSDVSITQSDDATIAATIENTGETELTQEVTLRANGAPLSDETVTLAGGAETEVVLTLDSSTLPIGSYTYEVSTLDTKRTGTVTVEDSESETGYITGNIVDTSGDLVSGASVTVRNPAAGEVVERVQSNGSYSVTVPSGEYTITAEYSGYEDGQTTVTVPGGRTTSADITLAPVSEPADIERVVSSSVSPGGTATVSLELTASSSSVSVSESFEPGFEDATIESVTVDGRDVSPFLTEANSDGAVVTLNDLEAGSKVIVEYTVSIPDDATVSSTYKINGEVTDDGESTVPGNTLTVTESSLDIRELSSDTISPGGEVTVSLETTVSSSSLSVTETFDPSFAEVTLDRITANAADITPVIAPVQPDGLVIVLDSLEPGETVVLEYTVSVNEDVAVGSTYQIDGEMTDDKTATIEASELTVQEGSPLDGTAGTYDADNDGEITVAELGVAAADYANSGLSLRELGAVAGAYANS